MTAQHQVELAVGERKGERVVLLEAGAITQSPAAFARALEVRFLQIDAQQRCSREEVRQPLGLYYWGQTWTLAAWCELRQGFRSFRLDRIDGLQVTAESFEKTPGHTLADFIAQVTAEDEAAKGKKRDDVS